MKKDLIYSLTCLAFSIIIGGAVYEHLNVVPKWTAGPPASLEMFQGRYGLKPELFWMIIHPVTITLLIISLIMQRKSPRKKNLVIVLLNYILVLVITSIYFVPELIEITTTSYATTIDGNLTHRANLWEILSIIRLAFLIILSLVLFTGLTKSGNSIKSSLTGKDPAFSTPSKKATSIHPTVHHNKSLIH